MNGLVSGYGTDSEDEDVESKSNLVTSGLTTNWIECFDESSGYVYYWNQSTNEVRWEKPEADEDGPPGEAPAPHRPNAEANGKNSEIKNGKPEMITSFPPLPPTHSKVKPPSVASNPNDAKKTTKKEKPSASLVFGPMLPERSPEEIAREKLAKMEEDHMNSVLFDIKSQTPPDWEWPGDAKSGRQQPQQTAAKPKSYLYTRPFTWERTKPVLSLVQQKEEEHERRKNAPNSISLIAGSYGDHSDVETDEDEPEDEPSKGSKRLMKIKVKPSASKQPRPQLRPVARIFQQASDGSGDEDGHENNDGSSVTNSKQPRSSTLSTASKGQEGRQDGLREGGSRKSSSSKQEVKVKETSRRKFIENSVETMSEKLEALNVNAIHISPLKILAVQLQALFGAWQAEALSSDYFKDKLTEMSNQLTSLETHQFAPPGWKIVWDRSEKRYNYQNLVTNEVQTHPPEEDDEIDHVFNQSSSPGNLPPLPPVPEMVPPPPPPPSSSPLPPLPPSSSLVPYTIDVSQVQDMELSDDEANRDEDDDAIAAQGHEHQSQKIKDALASFYSDLSSVDEAPIHHPATQITSFSLTTTPVATPPLCLSPGPSAASAPATGVCSRVESSDERSCSPFRSGEEAEKKKKKAKLVSGGLAMKKKGVENMVAKWQTIQQEVNRQHK